MKKLFLLSALFIAGVTVNAQQATRTPNSQQQQTNAESKAKKQTEELTKALDLTADQQTKVYNINLEKDKALETALSAKSSSPAEAKSKINAEREAAINAVLTADQQVKLKKAIEDRKAKKEAAPAK